MFSAAANHRPGRAGRSQHLAAAAVALAATALGGLVATAQPASAQSGWRVCGYISADDSWAVLFKIPKGDSIAYWDVCNTAQKRIKKSFGAWPNSDSVRRMPCEDIFRRMSLPDRCGSLKGYRTTPQIKTGGPTYFHYGTGKVTFP